MKQENFDSASLDRALRDLQDDVVEMASRAESMVIRAVEALSRLETGLAFQVMRDDDELDIRELVVEQQCIHLLNMGVATEAESREIGAVMRIITDIERIGDLAVDIAKISLKVEREMGSTDYVDIPLMANASREMLRTATQMFVRKDMSDFAKVSELENQVDELYRSLRDQIFKYMLAHHDQVVAAGWLLYAVHHLERMADHAMNIAERVCFMVSGEPASSRR